MTYTDIYLVLDTRGQNTLDQGLNIKEKESLAIVIIAAGWLAVRE